MPGTAQKRNNYVIPKSERSKTPKKYENVQSKIRQEIKDSKQKAKDEKFSKDPQVFAKDPP